MTFESLTYTSATMQQNNIKWVGFRRSYQNYSSTIYWYRAIFSEGTIKSIHGLSIKDSVTCLPNLHCPFTGLAKIPKTNANENLCIKLSQFHKDRFVWMMVYIGILIISWKHYSVNVALHQCKNWRTLPACNTNNYSSTGTSCNDSENWYKLFYFLFSDKLLSFNHNHSRHDRLRDRLVHKVGG